MINLSEKEESLLFNIVEGIKDDELRKLTFKTTKALIESIYIYNPIILEHSFRVAFLSVEISTQLDASPALIKTVALGGLLHDIGTIGVNRNLFSEGSKWTKDELEEYYNHTKYGKRIIEPMSEKSLWDITIPFIEKHHEYLNGSGFPNAISRQDIPFEVRILTVANDFDMMSNKFPWTDNYSLEERLAYIQRNSSVLYDEKIVETLTSLKCP